MKILRRLSLLDGISALYVLLLWCSILSFVVPGYVNMLFPIAGIVLLIIKYFNTIVTNQAFLWAVVYLGMLALVLNIHPIVGFGYGTGGMDTWLIEAGFILPSVVVGAVLLSQRRSESPRIIFWTFIIAIALSMIYVIPTLILERNAARGIALHGEEMLDSVQMSLKAGFWDYTQFHTIALVFIVFWGLRKYSQGQVRMVSTIASVLVLFIVIQIAITTTFIYLILVIGVLVYMYWKKHSLIGFIFLIGIIGAILIFKDAILEWLLEKYAGSDMEPKIRDFIDLINGDTGYHSTIDGRKRYQQDNIDAFFNSPIFGCAYQGGGHSVIWVRFGTGGLLCGVSFVMMIISLFRQWYLVIPRFSRIYFNLAWVGALILLYNKGVFGNTGWALVAFIVPAIVQMYESKISMRLRTNPR